jgi:hypothetical protein
MFIAFLRPLSLLSIDSTYPAVQLTGGFLYTSAFVSDCVGQGSLVAFITLPNQQRAMDLACNSASLPVLAMSARHRDEARIIIITDFIPIITIVLLALLIPLSQALRLRGVAMVWQAQ